MPVTIELWKDLHYTVYFIHHRLWQSYIKSFNLLFLRFWHYNFTFIFYSKRVHLKEVIESMMPNRLRKTPTAIKGTGMKLTILSSRTAGCKIPKRLFPHQSKLIGNPKTDDARLLNSQKEEKITGYNTKPKNSAHANRYNTTTSFYKKTFQNMIFCKTVLKSPFLS